MEFSLLDPKYVSDFSELDIFRKRGKTAAISDFAIILGGSVSSSNYAYGGKELKDRVGDYWVYTEPNMAAFHEQKGNLCVYLDNKVSYIGSLGTYNIEETHSGLRPIINFSDCSTFPTFDKANIAIDGITEIEYGYYPQTVAPHKLQKTLERCYRNNDNRLIKTGNSYTTNVYPNSYFHQQLYLEYMFEGKRYVRVKAAFCDDTQILSNGVKYSNGDNVNIHKDQYIWVEVEPVKWLLEKNKGFMITEKILVSGISYDHWRTAKNYSDAAPVPFKETVIKKFIDCYFAKDLVQDNELYMKKDNTKTGNIFARRKCNLSDLSLKIKDIRTKIEKMSTEEKREFLYSYARVTEKQYEEMRNIIVCIDKNLLSIYDQLWIGTSSQRYRFYKAIRDLEKEASADESCEKNNSEKEKMKIKTLQKND